MVIHNFMDFQAALNLIILIGVQAACIYYVRLSNDYGRWIKLTMAISIIPIMIVQIVFLLHVPMESYVATTLMLSSITAIAINKLISVIISINNIKRGKKK